MQTQRTLRGTQTPPSSPTSFASIQTTPKRKLTLSEKKKQASFVTSSSTSIAPISQYHYKLQALKDIEQLWRQGLEVAVEKIGSPRSGPSTSSGSNNDYVQTLQTVPESSEEAESYENDVAENNFQENLNSKGFSSSETFDIESTVSNAAPKENRISATVTYKSEAAVNYFQEYASSGGSSSSETLKIDRTVSKIT